MKVIKADERLVWETETSKVYEYPFAEKNLDCDVVEVYGRYPVSGWTRNTQVDEIIFCKEGKGEIVFDGNVKKFIAENDAVFIKKNEWYYWNEKTKGVFLTICNPAWSPEQGENKEF